MLTKMRTTRGLLAAAALMISTLPALDASAASALDEVALQNGGLVKGNILVMDPGEKVVIQVPGEDDPRTIPWSEVSDVQRGDDSEPNAEEASDEPEPAAKGSLRVHIESDDDDEPVVLTEHVRTGTVLTPYGTLVGIESNAVCSSPCNRTVDARDDKMYTINGDGVPHSEAFSLNGYEGDVTVHVDTGSNALRGGGTAALSLGVVGLIGGAVFLPVGVMLEDEAGTRSTGEDMTGAGIGMLVGGAAVLTAGIIMLSQSGTDVEVERGDAKQARRSPRPARWWHGEF
jgi:hypothetical protein